MGSSVAPIHVLYVHDDPDFSNVARRLEETDDRLSVLTTTSVEAGVERLGDSDVDCLVSDYELPGTDGVALLETVRETHPDLPFVLLASNGSEAVASDAISAGVTEYVPKRPEGEEYSRLADRIVQAVSQYRTDRARRERESRYRSVAEGTSDAITVVQDGEFVFANDAFVDLVNATDRSDVVGTAYADVVALDRHCGVAERVQTLEQNEGEGRHDGTVTALDGEEKAVEIVGTPVDYGGQSATQLLITDVTDRKTRERALEAAVDRMAFVLEKTETIIWEGNLDTDEVIRFGPIEKVFGISPDEIQTADEFYESVVHPDDRARVRQLHEEVRRGERDSFVTEYRTRPGTDDLRWIEDRAYVRSGATDDGRTIVGLLIDVTEQKRREQTLSRQNSRLDEFASTVSHDLRNPLQVACGRVELARDECDSDHLDPAARALARMEEMIDDLLTMARTEPTTAEIASIRVTPLVEDAWRAIQTEGMTLETDGVDGTSIRGDRSLLRNVFENLFRNVIDHNDPPVTVTVDRIDGDNSGIYIEDDGAGIPNDERATVFDHGYTTSDDGTGFGLSIVDEIVEAHGWYLLVAEGTEGGARFEITGVTLSDA